MLTKRKEQNSSIPVYRLYIHSICKVSTSKTNKLKQNNSQVKNVINQLTIPKQYVVNYFIVDKHSFPDMIHASEDISTW